MSKNPWIIVICLSVSLFYVNSCTDLITDKRLDLDLALIGFKQIQIMQENGNVANDSRYTNYYYSRETLSDESIQFIESITTATENLSCINDGVTYELMIEDDSGNTSVYVSDNRDCGRSNETDFISVTDIESLIANVNAVDCFFGRNQTCNADPVISSLSGRCSSENICECNDGFFRDPATGKCAKALPRTVTKGDDVEVVISGGFKICETDDECAIVIDVCDQCCEYQAINSSFITEYSAQFGEVCRDYSGGVCDCMDAPFKPLCNNGFCDIQPIDSPQFLPQ